MKFIKRREIFFISAVITSVLLLNTTASALTVEDDVEDVEYHVWVEGGTHKFVEYVDDKPNLDITEISYEISGGKITTKLQVAGVIEDSEVLTYSLQFLSDEGRYEFSYSNGEGIGESYVAGGLNLENPIISDGIIRCTFDWHGEGDYPTGTHLFGGQVQFHIWEGNEKVGYWVDTSHIPDEMYEDLKEDQEPDNGDGEAPGFETIVVLVALGIALIILRRRKIN
ncbi:MAG: hypothetical protein JSW60_05510 [Thermoplasmatales archaeon]|nr:MAG: hypothetical protein JSW60_05510 [Thermoplasmatales archaeon]